MGLIIGGSIVAVIVGVVIASIIENRTSQDYDDNDFKKDIEMLGALEALKILFKHRKIAPPARKKALEAGFDFDTIYCHNPDSDIFNSGYKWIFTPLQEWVLVGSSDSCDCFVKLDSIKNIGYDIIEFWLCAEYSLNGFLTFREELMRRGGYTEKCDNVRYSLQLYRINTKNNTAAIGLVTFYSLDGKLIIGYDDEKDIKEWGYTPMRTGTMEETIFNFVKDLSNEQYDADAQRKINGALSRIDESAPPVRNMARTLFTEYIQDTHANPLETNKRPQKLIRAFEMISEWEQIGRSDDRVCFIHKPSITRISSAVIESLECTEYTGHKIKEKLIGVIKRAGRYTPNINDLKYSIHNFQININNKTLKSCKLSYYTDSDELIINIDNPDKDFEAIDKETIMYRICCYITNWIEDDET